MRLSFPSPPLETLTHVTHMHWERTEQHVKVLHEYRGEVRGCDYDVGSSGDAGKQLLRAH